MKSRTMDGPLDIFIDFTAGSDTGRRQRFDPPWPLPDRFTARARRVTCLVHPDRWPAVSKLAAPLGWILSWSSSAIAACTEAMSRASTDRVSLLVLHGQVEATDEAVFAMRQALERDPMFGCAVARICCSNRCCLGDPRAAAWRREPGFHDERSPMLEIEVSAELSSRAFCFRRMSLPSSGRWIRVLESSRGNPALPLPCQTMWFSNGPGESRSHGCLRHHL